LSQRNVAQQGEKPMTDICEPFGPVYPDLLTVKKHRRRDGLAAMSRSDRQAYGLAVETAIRAKQRSELQRELPEHRCNCASGTNHNDGRAISKAMRAKHRAALAACPGQERRARTPQVWQAMYDEAMKQKRAREAQPMPLAA
jgi:hypothetical protein